MKPHGYYLPFSKAFLPFDDAFVHLPTASNVEPNDEIMVVLNGELRHSGRITDVMPSMGMCWIFDVLSGARKLIAWDEFRVFGRLKTKPSNVDNVKTGNDQ